MGNYYVPEFYNVRRDAEDELRIRKKQIEGKLKKIRHIKPGRALDIGCMKGEFLFELQKLGWEVEGVEISETPENLFNLNIHYGANFLEMDLPEKSYDLVTMWAVLEHVHDPMGFFLKIAGLLKPGGRFVFLVTNFDSPHGRWLHLDDFPRHLTMFTRETILKYLEKANLNFKKFYCDDEVFSTNSQGLLIFACRHLIKGEPVNKLADEFREDSRMFLTGGDSPSLARKIIYRLDNLLCCRILSPVLNLMGKGHIITVESEKHAGRVGEGN